MLHRILHIGWNLVHTVEMYLDLKIPVGKLPGNKTKDWFKQKLRSDSLVMLLNVTKREMR